MIHGRMWWNTSYSIAYIIESLIEASQNNQAHKCLTKLIEFYDILMVKRSKAGN